MTTADKFTPWLTSAGKADLSGLVAKDAASAESSRMQMVLSDLGLYDQLNKIRKYDEAISDPDAYMKNRRAAIAGVKDSVEQSYKKNFEAFLTATGDLGSAEKYAKARAAQDIDFQLSVIEASFPSVDDVLAKLASRRIHNVQEGLPIAKDRA